MTRLNDIILVPAVLLGLGLAPAAAQTANRFDGAWSVVATADSGSCAGPYRYPIVIRDGNVECRSQWCRHLRPRQLRMDGSPARSARASPTSRSRAACAERGAAVAGRSPA